MSASSPPALQPQPTLIWMMTPCQPPGMGPFHHHHHQTTSYGSIPEHSMKNLNWRVSAVTKCTHMHPANTHTHTCRLCSALVCLPYHPHLRSLLVISPVWLMFSCKYRGGKIPLLASTIQTGTSKGDKAALQVSHLFWWWLSSLEISQITHHPHSRWVTYFARPPPWL